MITEESYLSELLSKKSDLLAPTQQLTTSRRIFQNIEIKIKVHLHGKIIRAELFGSAARETNLPPEHDPNTDLDILIVFNDARYDRTPETYRNTLRSLVEIALNFETVKKRHPAVVIKRENANVDLVPCIVEDGDYLIPSFDNRWQETDPHDYTKTLSEFDGADRDHLLRIIRLLKLWNVRRNERFEAFDLEAQIIDSFSPCDTLAEEFLSVIDDLEACHLSKATERYLDGLKADAEWLRTYMEDENRKKMVDRFERIFR